MTGRRTVRIYGNWKMHKGPEEALDFFQKWSLPPAGNRCECGIAPPFVSLVPLVHLAKEKGLKLGAQNCHFEEKGAFTGEISAFMLKEMGVHFVILGHSERRLLFGEDSFFIAKKLRAALQAGLEVVLCVGETLEEREQGREKEVVSEMLNASLGDVTRDEIVERITIAYEPVWAIGTGRNATPGQAGEMHAFIREVIDERYGAGTGTQVTVQYGGSVKPSNVEELASVEDIDGFLVGGASLETETFADIIEKTLMVKQLR